MKELSIEEKAKRYDEAIEQLRKMMPNWDNLSYNGKTFIQDLVHIIPELKESEDEKIRKELISLVNALQSSKYTELKHYDKYVAWLEKQGENKSVEITALVCPKCMKSFDTCKDYPSYHNRINYICPHCGYDGDSTDFETSYKSHPIHSVTPQMIQWKGDNLKEVIDFTGKSDRFDEWFKNWEEFEEYVHKHGNILKLFDEYGSHYEVPVGAWIVKTPDGYNVPSVFTFKQKPVEWSEEDENAIAVIQDIIRYSDKIDANIYTNEVKEKLFSRLKSLKDRAWPQPKQEWSEKDEEFFKTALWHISYSISNGKSTDIHCDTTDWLKSLKERYTWKPNISQLGALRRLVNTSECFGHVEYELLQLLYEDLKKLKS